MAKRVEIVRAKDIIRNPRRLTRDEADKRKAAADSLHGIWSDLPSHVVKTLMEKTYP